MMRFKSDPFSWWVIQFTKVLPTGRNPLNASPYPCSWGRKAYFHIHNLNIVKCINMDKFNCLRIQIAVLDIPGRNMSHVWLYAISCKLTWPCLFSCFLPPSSRLSLGCIHPSRRSRLTMYHHWHERACPSKWRSKQNSWTTKHLQSNWSLQSCLVVG